MFTLTLTRNELMMLLDAAVADGPEAYVPRVRKVLCSAEDTLFAIAHEAGDGDADAARAACATVHAVIYHFSKKQQKPHFYNEDAVMQLRAALFGWSHDVGRNFRQCSVATLAKYAMHCGLAETWDFNCHALAYALTAMRYAEQHTPEMVAAVKQTKEHLTYG